MPVNNCCKIPGINTNLNYKEIFISKMDRINILGSIILFILCYIITRVNSKVDLLHDGIIAVLVGFIIAFLGWEYEWTTGCGLGRECGDNYKIRQKNSSAKITTPTWLHAVVCAGCDGFFIGTSFLLAWMIFPNSTYLPSWKFIFLVVFLGVFQNILITYKIIPKIALDGLAASPLAPKPQCRNPNEHVCWRNQSMWVKLPLLCYLVCLIIHRGI